MARSPPPSASRRPAPARSPRAVRPGQRSAGPGDARLHRALDRPSAPITAPARRAQRRRGIVEGIAFFKPGLAEHLPRGRRVDVCIALERDEWQGMVRVRARLRDIRPARPEPVVAVLKDAGRPSSPRVERPRKAPSRLARRRELPRPSRALPQPSRAATVVAQAATAVPAATAVARAATAVAPIRYASERKPAPVHNSRPSLINSRKERERCPRRNANHRQVQAGEADGDQGRIRWV